LRKTDRIVFDSLAEEMMAKSNVFGSFVMAATDEEHQAARHRAYPQAVGVLYASTVTRPDLSQAASQNCAPRPECASTVQTPFRIVR